MMFGIKKLFGIGQSRIDKLAAAHPKIQFECYVCGSQSQTYKGCVTVPPDPATIRRREDIEPVVTCGAQYCRDFEVRRQDALLSYIMQPVLQDYLIKREQEKKRARDKTQGKKKDKGND